MDVGLVGHVIWMNFILLLIVMGIGWLYFIFNKNGALLDLTWAAGFLIVAITSFTSCEGTLFRKFILLILAALWSIRLGCYFLKRYLKKEEDGRYKALKDSFGAYSDVKFLGLFLMQAVLITIVSWPFVLICSNTSPQLSSFEWCSVALFLIAFGGEVLADRQLVQFKEKPENKFKVCQEGLWGYSRHPNYFFEWLVWVAFFLLAIDAPLGITAIISPLLMWHLLVNVSGVKRTEEHALMTKGDEYVRYQGRTNMFFPWFKKK